LGIHRDRREIPLGIAAERGGVAHVAQWSSNGGVRCKVKH
jgi:hypothetical protein